MTIISQLSFALSLSLCLTFRKLGRTKNRNSKFYSKYLFVCFPVMQHMADLYMYMTMYIVITDD